MPAMKMSVEAEYVSLGFRSLEAFVAWSNDQSFHRVHKAFQIPLIVGYEIVMSTAKSDDSGNEPNISTKNIILYEYWLE